jgi:acetyltransferase-like isoleucine patch superfamily enzyme
MGKYSKNFRAWLLELLGVHEVCLLKGDDLYRHIAHRLLNVQLVFGRSDNLSVGQGVILNNALINTTSGSVTLMDYAFCGHGVSILTGTHDYHRTGVERQAAVPSGGRDILIEEGVWIGSNATVIGPCVIGRNSVIAAGAVVTGNVEAGCIYAGVPARKIMVIELSEQSARAVIRK